MFKELKSKVKEKTEVMKAILDCEVPVKGSKYIVGGFFVGSGIAYWAIWLITKFVGLATHKHYEIMVTEV